jgi:hypothetical protein
MLAKPHAFWSFSMVSLTSPRAAALLSLLLLAPASASAAPECAQIEDGTITLSDGTPVVVGDDGWGYDYADHAFEGDYCASNRQLSCPYQGTELAMVWNDAWLSSQDCDHDGKLDRHHGFATYRGSGAELSNAMHGRYTEANKLCDYYYYALYIAAPLDAIKLNGNWVAANGTVLGAVIWTDFYVALTSYNTICFDGDPPPSE